MAWQSAQIRQLALRVGVIFQQGDNIVAKTKLNIDGMSCQHCVKTVTDALTELEGVRRAKVNLRKGEAVVHFDAARITPANLTTAITEAGFKAL